MSRDHRLTVSCLVVGSLSFLAFCGRGDRAPQAPTTATVGRQDGVMTTEERKILASTGAAGDEFGAGVDAASNLAIIGAPFDDDGNGDAGSATVYVQSAGDWSQRRKLAPTQPVAGGHLGASVAVDGLGIAVVGAPAAGRAYVFVHDQNGPNQWGEATQLPPPVGATEWGQVVAVGLDRAVVASGNGYVSVFTHVQGNFAATVEMPLTDGTAADGFGVALAIYDHPTEIESFILVGAPQDDDGGSDVGAAYLYSRAGSLVKKLVPGSAGGSAGAGSSVAIHGDLAILGAPGAGAAYVFARDHGAADNWGEVTTLSESGVSDFGSSVGVYRDAAAIASPANGEVFVYRRDEGGADSWGWMATLTPAAASDGFGNALALDNYNLVVGASVDDDTGLDAGAAHTFEIIFLGGSCTSVSDCKSGHCVDGVCCEQACTDECMACSNGKTGDEDGWCRTALDDVPCDDGDACLRVDTCQSGVCTGSDPVSCVALDQCHEPGTCEPTTGACNTPNRADDSTCDDDNPCTRTDVCVAGRCVGTQPVVCTALDVCHVAGVCEPATGECTEPPAPDGKLCNDVNVCTQTDACLAGACVGAQPRICQPIDQCHDVGSCDSVTGQCPTPSKPDGVGCDDGWFCTVGDTCTGGVCSGTIRMCELGVSCRTGACNPVDGACTGAPVADDSACDDGESCSHSDNCQSGECLGTAYSCDDEDPCTDDVCDGDGGCSQVANTAACDDDDPCTVGDVCCVGGCAGVAYSCDDGNSCTDDVCNGDGTCTRTFRTGSCDDDNECTQADTCQGGRCVGANPVVCVPADSCHAVGVCDPATGVCSDPVRADGTTCDDSAFCTIGDTCQGGNCTGGGPRTCTNGVSCAEGACDEASDTCDGSAFPDGYLCDDGDSCTRSDSCTAGVCGGVAFSCDDSDPCTEDVCRGDGTCERRSQNGACDDASLCTFSDACVVGLCLGIAYSCDDANPCTDDQCGGDGSCTNVNNTAPCNDGNACTQPDGCVAGECQSGPDVCVDGALPPDGGSTGSDGGPQEDGAPVGRQGGGPCGCGPDGERAGGLGMLILALASLRRRVRR